jgi:outer membrane protein OmpA-like peptidoglycan-associated protein
MKNGYPKYCWIILLLFVLPAVSWAKNFEFNYREGEKYRILSTVEQDVYINREFSHHAAILNRISVEVTGADDDWGKLEALFITSEESLDGDQVFAWGNEYFSEFKRDRLGYYTIDPSYFMPVVRDVPVFPEREINTGESWSAKGREAHDFRASFGLEEAFHFDYPVHYTYLGTGEKDGKKFDLIKINYNVFHNTRNTYGGLYPVRITGSSNQTLYWDYRLGRPYAYEEEYVFIFNMSNGMEIEYSGTAEAKVLSSSVMNRDKVVEEIQNSIKEQGIEDTTVRPDERGVTITLENIQFPPDSSELIKSERQKIMKIGQILKKYPERDILITGHTALAGTPEGRQQLSEERAKVVGEFLLELGIRVPDRLIYRGMGAREPIADNSTEFGMRQNRRVEITILEN